MDGNTRAIAEALRRWYEAGPQDAKVIDLAAARRQREQAKRKPRPAQPQPGGHAA